VGGEPESHAGKGGGSFPGGTVKENILSIGTKGEDI